jgi:hypothetical protein
MTTVCDKVNVAVPIAKPTQAMTWNLIMAPAWTKGRIEVIHEFQRVP